MQSPESSSFFLHRLKHSAYIFPYDPYFSMGKSDRGWELSLNKQKITSSPSLLCWKFLGQQDFLPDPFQMWMCLETIEIHTSNGSSYIFSPFLQFGLYLFSEDKCEREGVLVNLTPTFST